MLQNNAPRAVKQVSSRFSATELHNVLEIDWLDVYRKRYTCSEVFNFVNGSGPPSLVSPFEESVPTRILRSNEAINLRPIVTRTTFAEHVFVIRGIKY